MIDILLIEDKESFARMLTEKLIDGGLDLKSVKKGQDGLELIRRERFAVALVDLKLPDMDGIAVLREIRKIDPETSVIIMTAFGTVETAVEAMKLGAYDFITKPFESEHLILIIKRLLKEYQSRLEHLLLKETYQKELGLPEIVGQSVLIKEAASLAQQVAPSDTSVLLLGESGTGKELFARAIHLLSKRREFPFVAINCAAIPGELLENELFGSEKGAYTGAYSRKIGKFELANKGTVFLDEVGDMALPLQAKILRVLQEKTFERLGGTAQIKVDVRIVAASNRGLKEMVKVNKFRDDLYYRLSVFPITLPPLRSRKEDIPMLAENFMKRVKERKTVTPQSVRKLKGYDWPGNIRELENTLERAVILSKGDILPESILIPEGRQSFEPVPTSNLKTAGKWGQRQAETELIKRVLSDSDGNKMEASRRLKVSYKTLLKRIKEYDIEK